MGEKANPRPGATSCTRKPVSFDQFNEAVKQLGMYSPLLNETPPFMRGG